MANLSFPLETVGKYTCSTRASTQPHMEAGKLLGSQWHSSLKSLNLNKQTPPLLREIVCTWLRVISKIVALPTSLSLFPPALLFRAPKPFVLVRLLRVYWKLGSKNRPRKCVFGHLCCGASCFVYEAGTLHLLSKPSRSWCLNIMWPRSLLQEYDVLLAYCSSFLHFLLPEWKSSDYPSQCVLWGHVSASSCNKFLWICGTISSFPAPRDQQNLCKGADSRATRTGWGAQPQPWAGQNWSQTIPMDSPMEQEKL